MDAKERHELKDNDLAEFLENFGAFWSKRGDTISTVFFVAVAAWVLWFGLPVLNWHGLQQYRKSSVQSQERVWGDLWVVSTPQGYRELARETEGYAGVPYIALLRGAEAYHKDAIAIDQDDADADSGLMSAEESLASATSMYKQVLDSQKADPVFRANAAVGLANVSETRRDFEAASQYWEQAKTIAEQANLGSIAKLTELRGGMLDELAKPIDLVDAPETAAEPLSETPEIGDPISTDISGLMPADIPLIPESDPAPPADPGP